MRTRGPLTWMKAPWMILLRRSCGNRGVFFRRTLASCLAQGLIQSGSEYRHEASQAPAYAEAHLPALLCVLSDVVVMLHMWPPQSGLPA